MEGTIIKAICAYCGKEYERSKGSRYDKKYCSDECCNTARRIKYQKERENRICKKCGKKFVYTTEIGHSWFCSDECAKQWKYEHDGLRKAQEDANRRCAEWIQNGVPENFTVLSDWKEGDGNVEIEIRCNDCGGIFTKPIYVARRVKNCPCCVDKRKSEKEAEKEAEKEKKIAEKEKAIEEKEQLRQELLSIDRVCAECGTIFHSEYEDKLYCSKRCQKQAQHKRKQDMRVKELLSIDKFCKCCGKIFHSADVHKKYCSDKCSKKMNRDRAKAKRRLRIVDNYIEDVSLEKLYKRDSGICYLCGKKTDYSDYEIIDGVFIAGNMYPSIDHIIPVCEGGEHSYKNTKLAHRICNSRRYYEEKENERTEFEQQRDKRLMAKQNAS